MRFLVLSEIFLTFSILANGQEVPARMNDLIKNAERRQAKTIEEFLKTLPVSFHEEFVWRHTSKSLHKATFEFPRTISFGFDGRLIIAVGNVESDPRYSLIEFAEFDPERGTYQFGTLSISNGKYSTNMDSTKCSRCHGAQPRPIWEEYPFTGESTTYGGSPFATIVEGDKEQLKNFLAKSRSTPRFSVFTPFEKYLQEGNAFLSPGRKYKYMVTNLILDISSTIAFGIGNRIKKTLEFDKLKYFLAVQLTNEKIFGHDSNPNLSYGGIACDTTPQWEKVKERIFSYYHKRRSDDPIFAAKNPILDPSLKLSARNAAYRILGIDADIELGMEKLGSQQYDDGLVFYWRGFGTIEHMVLNSTLFHVLNSDEVARSGLPQAHNALKRYFQILNMNPSEREEYARNNKNPYHSEYIQFYPTFKEFEKDKELRNSKCSYFSKRAEF